MFGFENFIFIIGGFIIDCNFNLEDIFVFENLIIVGFILVIGGSFFISGNFKLENFNGLDNLIIVGNGMIVINNFKL